MATAKIRKTSTFTLWALIAISIIVILAFFFGGDSLDAKGNLVYENTSLLLVWTYILSGLTILATVVLGLFSRPKAAHPDVLAKKSTLIVLAVFVITILVSYFLGDSTALTTLNADNQEFNTPTWLKLTDTFLYSTYILSALIVVAVLWGALKKAFDK